MLFTWGSKTNFDPTTRMLRRCALAATMAWQVQTPVASKILIWNTTWDVKCFDSILFPGLAFSWEQAIQKHDSLFPLFVLPQEGWIPNYPWCCFSARIQSNTAPGGHLLTSSWTPFSGAEKHCCCKAEPSLMALSSLIGNMGSWVDGGVLTNGTTSDMICYDIWHMIFELWYSIGPRIWYDLIWSDMMFR